ncbi:MAG: hypothetical protein LBC41_11660 [Clostridiales bacterium]|nr:hypothetical protein [Clostridiales bacterium]
MPFDLETFSIDLRKTLTPPTGIWASSGYSVCAPLMGTAAGVRGLFSPPFAAPDICLEILFTANGHPVPDNGSKGKEDCGLLYAGGDWLPGKVKRRGTYHFMVAENLISFEVLSELVPLFGKPGFALELTVKNRMKSKLAISATPVFSPGAPSIVPLSDWEFTPPKPGSAALKTCEGLWENDTVQVSLIAEEQEICLKESESGTFRFAVILASKGEEAKDCSISELSKLAEARWKALLELASDRIPSLKTDIPGLEAYYNRSVLSGLVCLWENDSYATNPFPATSGVDGGSICCYPWDVAGYSGRALVMLLGGKALDFLKAMLESGIDRHISMALDGSGLGWCSYSYSMWSLISFYSSIISFTGEGLELFDPISKAFLKEEERLPEWEHLKDYGRQHNLLEMRSCGYEYLVASPNAERAWCYDRLADIQDMIKGPRGHENLREKAQAIRDSIRRNLWDNGLGWFKCLHPDGHSETVYSIQAYDAMKCGACDDNMKEALFSHLRDGAFLGKYGVTSISAEDQIHYELNDPDWSGGGCYSGDGPELAEILWNEGRPDLAWDILKRHFWMGEHLLYYPQEHYCDIPAVPPNKRANIIAGTAGMHAVLFGMAGIRILLDGSISIDPNPPKEGFVEISGIKVRDKEMGIFMKPGFVRVTVDGAIAYEGVEKKLEF